MIIERGVVAATEDNGFWVEAVQKSVCSGCKVKQGCGQGLLSKYSKSSGYLWVMRGGVIDQVSVGDEISFGLPEDIIVKSSLIIYMIPLLLLLCGTVGAYLINTSDLIVMCGSVLGLVLGSVIVKIHAKKTKYDVRYQPIFLGMANSLAYENVELKNARFE